MKTIEEKLQITTKYWNNAKEDFQKQNPHLDLEAWTEAMQGIASLLYATQAPLNSPHLWEALRSTANILEAIYGTKQNSH